MKMLNLDKEKRYLLACSYGPDSMALFSMLKRQGYNFSVAHVCYNLRPEATKETEDLKEYCEKQKINLFIENVHGSSFKGNIEEQCRVIRYKFFKKIADLHGFSSVLVAHQKDDLIETYIMQKRRHNFVEYYGLKEDTNIFGINVIRPLLSYTKEELQNYCLNNNVPFAIDSSNLQDIYLRNKIRHEIVSKMNSEEKCKTLIEIENQNNEIHQIGIKLKEINFSSVTDMLRLNEKELSYALNLFIKEVDSTAYVSKGLSKEIRNILISKKPNVCFEIKNNIAFNKSYDHCCFLKKELPSLDYSFSLEKPGVLNTEFFFLDFTKDPSNRNVFDNDYPITIRNAKYGDLVQIKGYEVNVRRLFIDWKMPTELRKRWPIIINKDNKVIYIPRYQKNFVQDEQLNFYVK